MKINIKEDGTEITIEGEDIESIREVLRELGYALAQPQSQPQPEKAPKPEAPPPYLPFPPYVAPPSIPLPYVTDPCTNGGPHTYPDIWMGIVPPNCLVCGKAASMWTTTYKWTTDSDMTFHPDTVPPGFNCKTCGKATFGPSNGNLCNCIS